MKICLLIIQSIVLMLSFECYSQINQGGEPLSFRLKSEKLAQQRRPSATYDLPNIDNELELKNANKILEECKTCRKDFYGKPINVKIDLKKSSEWIEVEGGKIWIYHIQSGTAKGLQFYFEAFKIPEGARLHIYDEQHNYILGAFTEQNNNPYNKFATRIFPDKHAVLEYFEPTNSQFSGTLILNKVVHVFKDFNQTSKRSGAGFEESGSCTVNVNCPDGSLLSEEKKAVALISYFDLSTGLNALCTGFLINSTNSVAFKKPYFMTAAHCVSNKTAGYYFDYIFYFNYENSGCTNNETDPLFQSDSFQGAYLRSVGDEAHLTTTDYALLELYNKPENYASVSYLGWDKRTTTSTLGTYNISHPSGDAKKIALDFESPVAVSTISAPCLTSSNLDAWQVNWNQGVTEPGSSGSPLLNGFKRVIGVLSGGNSRCSDSQGTDFCGNTLAQSGPDWFSRVDYLWNHANPGITEVLYYLDGANTGAEYLDSYIPPIAPGNPYVIIRDITLTSNAFEKPNNRLIPEIETYGNTGTLSYSWSPSGDFSYPNLKDGVITFGNSTPVLPLTRTYTLSVTPQNGTGASKSITVTLYDCVNRNISIDACLNSDIQLGKTGSSGETYSWSPSTNLSNASIANPVFNSSTAGVFNYALTATSSGCTRIENYSVYVEDIPSPESFTPSIIGQNTISGTSYKRKFTKTADGGFLIGSYNGANKEIIKINSQLNEVWRQNIETLVNGDYEVKLTTDGGFILAGNWIDIHYNITPKLIKLDANWNVVWSYSEPETVRYGKKIVVEFAAVHQTSDGGYIIAGFEHEDGFVYPYYPIARKFSSSGTLEWGNYYNYPFDINLRNVFIRQTNDGAYLLSGDRSIFKLEANGLYQWHNTYDTYNIYDGIIGLEVLNDGTFIIGSGGDGYRLRKLNSSGVVLWDKRYGGLGYDKITTVIKTSDEGFLLAGFSDSPQGEHKSEDSRGTEDYWIVKLDRYGNKAGDKRYGGSDDDDLYGVVEGDNGTYFLAGWSSSGNDGDKTSSLHGIWLLEIQDGGYNPNPEITKICQSFPSTFDNTSAPIKNEVVYLGPQPPVRGGGSGFTCLSAPIIESGAKVYIRASSFIKIAKTTIKRGSSFSAKAEIINLHPCDPSGGEPGGRIRTNISEEDLITASASPENMEGVELYPNPARGTVNLHCRFNKISDIRISVTNALKEIHSELFESTNVIDKSFDLSSYASGLYIFTIKTDHEFIIKKVMLTR